VVMYYLGFRMGLYNTELLTRQSLDYSTVPGEVSIQGVYCRFNDLSGSIEFA
jgi:hypothetical protein